MSKTKTIAVFGVGPGMGRAVVRRFGREGFQVALVARNQTRLDAFTAELAADGITAAGFAGDIADRNALPGLIEAITTTSSRPMARPTCRSRKSPPTSPTPCGTSTSSATGSTRSSEHDPREADGPGRRPPGIPDVSPERRDR